MHLRPLRCLLFAVSAFAVTVLVVGYANAGREAGIQHWDEVGLGWLKLDHWAHVFPWRAGVVAAAGAGAVMLAAEGWGETKARFLRPLRSLNTVFGHVVPAVVLLALAWFVPRLTARFAQPDPPAGSPNLLFVLVDTWRADHAGFLGYERPVSPTFDRLVERGVVFERAISPTGWTKPSVATLLTGVLPSRHMAVSMPVQGIPGRGISLPRPLTTLTEVLRGHGWDTAMWSPNPNINAYRGFAQGAGLFVDYFNHPERTKDYDPGRSERMVPAVQRWLGEERDPTRPFCAYVHVMDPHYPYRAPAPFQGTFDHSDIEFNLDGPTCDGYRDGTRDLSHVTPEMVRKIIDIYDEELLYVDHHIGGFVDEVLKEYPNTVVVLVGDHGEEFLEHGGWGHASTLYEELVHVPLVLWAPDLAAGRIPTQVPLMDVFPTVLDMLGLADHIPEPVQGKTLRPLLEGNEGIHRLAPLETGGDQRPAWQWRGLSDGRRKMVRREEDLPTVRPIPPLGEWERILTRPTWFLFDLEEDPGEERNLFHEGGEEEARALFETLRTNGWFVPPADLLRLRATRTDLGANSSALRDLGYASSGEGKEDE